MFTLHSKLKRKQKEKKKKDGKREWHSVRPVLVCLCVWRHSLIAIHRIWAPISTFKVSNRKGSASKITWDRRITIAFSARCILVKVAKSNQKCKFPTEKSIEKLKSCAGQSIHCDCVYVWRSFATLIGISRAQKKNKRNKPQNVQSDFVPWSFSTSENGIYKQTKKYFQILSRRRAFYFYSLINRCCCCCCCRRISFWHGKRAHERHGSRASRV